MELRVLAAERARSPWRHGEGPEGATLRESWLRDLGLWYSDHEADAAGQAVMGMVQRIDARFYDLVVEITQQLHDEQVVSRIFGRPIPVIIHDSEYYDTVAERNRRANPNGVAEVFARWIDDMY